MSGVERQFSAPDEEAMVALGSLLAAVPSANLGNSTYAYSPMCGATPPRVYPSLVLRLAEVSWICSRSCSHGRLLFAIHTLVSVMKLGMQEPCATKG